MNDKPNAPKIKISLAKHNGPCALPAFSNDKNLNGAVGAYLLTNKKMNNIVAIIKWKTKITSVKIGLIFDFLNKTTNVDTNAVRIK